MPIVRIEGVSLAYGHVPLLDHADLVIEPGERIGLIGRNGTGKSSLLKILGGLARADDGTIWRQPGLGIAIVDQEPELDPTQSVFEAVIAGLGERTTAIAAYHEAARTLSSSPHDAAALVRLQRAQEALDENDGWQVEQQVETVLSKLAMSADAQVETLSGGLRKRVALARALVSEPGLLVLDEPTNHLDLDAIAWLEETLIAYPGSVLVVTHDRAFLDRVVTRIIELDRGRLGSFPGNFAIYETRKLEQLANEAVANAKFDKLLAQEEVWIRKGIEARRTRNEGRVRRLERLRVERSARRERLGQVNINLGEGERSGQLVAELEHVDKAFGERVVVKDFSCRILRGDKIGLIGPNGIGKSTLIKLILGELEADAGKVRRGSKLAVAYFDQFRAQLDDAATVAQTIAPGSDFIEVDGVRKHVMSYLGDFLFPPERARSPVKALSGGERNRLLLARLFSQTANLLVLDEPTNDLDIETLELLEALIQEYPGTVLLVSHDRAFLDNVVTDTISAEGAGRWVRNAGGYTDWKRLKTERVSRMPGAMDVPKKLPVSTDSQPAATRDKAIRPKKLSFKESRELEAIPARIEALEREQAALSARLADPELYRQPGDQIKVLQTRIAQIDNELSACLTRWAELEKIGVA
jgi:ABC transport system ATP-binding/permease protein